MPKTICKCGYIIDESPIPCPQGYYMMSDIDLYKSYDILPDVNGYFSLFELFDMNLSRFTVSVLKCSNCRRLIVYDKDSSNCIYYREEKHVESSNRTYCQCGYNTTDNDQLNKNSYRLISEIDLNTCYNSVPKERDQIEVVKQFCKELSYYSKHVQNCPVCRRLTIVDHLQTISYIKEDV